MLYTLLNILYVPVCIFLILVVLLQTGKRADLAGAFGGGGSQTAFGARGAATLLTKLTTGAAVLFMLCALALAMMTTRRASSRGSVLDEVPESTSAPVEQTTPAPASDLPPLSDVSPTEDTTGEPAAEDPSVDLLEDDVAGAEAPPEEGSQP